MLTFDITNDFIVGDRITKETLNKYSKLPHKIKAGLFLLCVEGSVQASINLAKYTINKYDFVTLVPSNFIQFHEISDDARFYFAGFSSEFMTNINFIKSTMSFLPVITEHPIMPLEESVAQLIECVNRDITVRRNSRIIFTGINNLWQIICCT